MHNKTSFKELILYKHFNVKLIDRIRREYEEFIQITKLENESFRTRQLAEYSRLKDDFDHYKNVSFEEKKNISIGNY